VTEEMAVLVETGRVAGLTAVETAQVAEAIAAETVSAVAETARATAVATALAVAFVAAPILAEIRTIGRPAADATASGAAHIGVMARDSATPADPASRTARGGTATTSDVQPAGLAAAGDG
jgi:hypothetical protein